MNRNQRRLVAKHAKKRLPPPSSESVAENAVGETLAEALRLHQAGELARAETLYRQVLAARPDNPDAIHLLGTIAYQRGDYELAARQIGQAIELRPDDSAFHNNLANVRSAQQHLDEAARLFERAIALNPDNAGAHFNLGNTVHKQGRHDQAAGHHQRAIELQPGHAGAHNALGNVHYAQDRLDQAIVEYREALAIDPAFTEAHGNIAVAFWKRGRLDEAAEHCEMALAFQPGLATVHRCLGHVRREQRRFVEAVEHTEASLAATPDDAEAHNNLGNIRHEQGRLSEAAEHYRKALACNADYALAHYNLAGALRGQGKLDEAIDHCRSAIAVRSDYADAFVTLGSVLVDRGERDEAVVAFGRAVECDPTNQAARHFLAAAKGEATEIAPRNYVRDLFDQHAAAFDRQLVDDLEYQTPELACLAIRAVAGDNARFLNVIDLGCGTGLSGVAFRPLAKRLSGIDLSPRMIEEAERKNVYDTIHEGDVVEFLDSSDDEFDLFVSTDVFIYVGELTNVFGSMAWKSMGRAHVVFSVERCDGDSYVLRDSGRYAHSPTYIARLADDHGFEIRLRRTVNLRKHRGKWIPGEVYVLQLRP